MSENKLIRSEEEKSKIKNVAQATVFQASDWVSGKVRLKADEFLAIRNPDARREYYESVKSASAFDADENTRTFWDNYLNYLNNHL